MFKIFAAKLAFLKCNRGSVHFVQFFPRLIRFNESIRVNLVNFSYLESLKHILKDNSMPRLIRFNESRRVNSVNFSCLESLKNIIKDDSIGVPLSCLDNRAQQRENSKPETVHFP